MRSLPTLTLLLALGFASAETYNLHIASSGGNASSPLAYGIMFEDINHSGDGGIYAELLQNRAFQGSAPYPSTISPWSATGGADLSLLNLSAPLSTALPTSLRVSGGKGKVALVNPGWWGIEVKPQRYRGSFWVKGVYNGGFTAKLVAETGGEVFAASSFRSRARSGEWVEHTFDLYPRTAAPDSNNTFVLEFDAPKDMLDFNLLSLFPPTYKDRPNGNRVELMEGLEGLKPSFFRIPGGNNLEGESASHVRWKWNETIGPLKDRPGRPGTWGYQNTDGIGLIEYLDWCTDLSVEPLLAIWDGLYLNGYISPPDIIASSDLQPYVQDALNELEFILGAPSTTYGSLRASLGRPHPWSLKYVEIGNEDHLGNASYSYSQYRFRAFYDAIHAVYPNLTLISSTGDLTAVAGTSGTDYHQYARPDHFAAEFGYWDHWDPNHKVVVGEFAVIEGNADPPETAVDWSGVEPRLAFPTWVGAVAEAVFSLGTERSPAVLGITYAPGFQNLNSFQWAPDLVSFTSNTAETILSTSYHVLKLLSSYRYTSTVPITSFPSNTTTSSAPSLPQYGPSYYLAGISSPGHYTFKAAVYNATEPQVFNLTFAGLGNGKAELTVLTSSAGGLAQNVPGGEDVVVETVSEIEVVNGTVGFVLENYSVAVLTT